MHLFYGNPNVDLFNILQIIKIKSENGQGIQSLVKEIAEQKYGYVSKRFKLLLKRIDKGDDFLQAVNKIMESESNKYLYNLFNMFKMASEGNISLLGGIEQIENQILSEHKGEYEKYLEHTAKFSAFIMYALMLPFIYLVIVILNWVVTDFFEGGKEILNETYRLYFYFLNLAGLILMLYFLRYRK